MPQIGNKCPGRAEYHTFASRFCLDQCPNQCLPPSALIHIQNKQRVDKHVGDYVSATALLGCPRQIALERTMDYYIEPPKNWYSLRGTLLHNILENPDFAALVTEMRSYVYRLFARGEADREDIEPRWVALEAQLMDLAAMLPNINHINDWESEVEFEMPLGTINGRPRKLKGTIDVLRRNLGQIKDYKTMGDKGLGILKKGLKPEHVMQFNIYRLLAERGYPVGESYSTYTPITIKSIEAFYMTMMQVVKSGGVFEENTGWLVTDGDAAEKSRTGKTDGPEVILGSDEIGTKTELKTKKGKKKTSTNPNDFEVQNYSKFRVTYAIPEVPLLPLDTVEKFVHDKAPHLFDFFERGIMPPMCDPEMREWKCDSFCADQIRAACDAHNAKVGESRIVQIDTSTKTVFGSL